LTYPQPFVRNSQPNHANSHRLLSGLSLQPLRYHASRSLVWSNSCMGGSPHHRNCHSEKRSCCRNRTSLVPISFCFSGWLLLHRTAVLMLTTLHFMCTPFPWMRVSTAVSLPPLTIPVSTFGSIPSVVLPRFAFNATPKLRCIHPTTHLGPSNPTHVDTTTPPTGYLRFRLEFLWR
jgi:hypothetical protein